jgi:hypothetical protein
LWHLLHGAAGSSAGFAGQVPFATLSAALDQGEEQFENMVDVSGRL